MMNEYECCAAVRGVEDEKWKQNIDTLDVYYKFIRTL